MESRPSSLGKYRRSSRVPHLFEDAAPEDAEGGSVAASSSKRSFGSGTAEGSELEAPEPILLYSTGSVGALTATGEIYHPEPGVERAGSEFTAKKQMQRVSWPMASVFMTAQKFGVGSLSLPNVCAVLGIGGFTISLFTFGLAAMTGLLMLRKVKMRYPWFHFYSDITEALYGRVGWYIGYIVMMIAKIVPLMANVFTSALGIESMANNSFCLVGSIAIASVGTWLFIQMRTLHGIKHAIAVAFFALFIPAVVTIVYVPINEGQLAPNLTGFSYGTGFSDTVVALMDVAFAFAGSVFAPVYMAEMKNPADFDKATYMSVAFLIPMFYAIGLVVYLYRGDNSLSPGFDNITGSSTLRRVMWGIAFVHTIIVAALIGIAMMQDVFTRLFGWSMMMQWTPRSMTYYGLVSGAIMVVSFVVINLVPFFNEFVSLGSSIVSTAGTYGLPFLFIAEIMRADARNNGVPLTKRQRIISAMCYAMFGGAVVLSLIGIVATMMQIVDEFSSGSSLPFTCDV